MATLFDNLGFISPYIIRIKIILQELWISGLDWDDDLPREHAFKLETWFDEQNEFSSSIQLSRCLKKNAQEEEKSIHIFSDASSEAYGAVAYQQCMYNSGKVTSCLVMSKARVAPLKSISIPRLELLGAILGLKLAEKVAGALQMEMKDVTFWCDSMSVLWWIRNQSRKLKPFVANRVGLIHLQTDSNQWRYIPTKMNIADLLNMKS